MKSTRYFQVMRLRKDRATIQDAWIRSVIARPLRKRTQMDGRIQLWGRVNELDGKILRVILLEDGETVHNAFFDRGFRP